MRIGIARIAQETNTFSPTLTGLDAFRSTGVHHGDDVLDIKDSGKEIPGLIEGCHQAQLIGVISAETLPGGCLTHEAENSLLDWFTRDLQTALPLDGLLLSIHGALAGVSDPDFDGRIVQTARQILGNQAPIAVSLDLHANITRRKIVNANLLRGYHTHPHIDARETGRFVSRLLMETLRGRVRTTMSAVKIPMITPAETQLTTQNPLKALIEVTLHQEARPHVLSSSIFTVQPWLDVPELGWCSVVVTDGDPHLADRMARELAQIAWEQRYDYIQPCHTYKEALDEAFAVEDQPVVISDFADLMTGGGTGDSTWYLKELLARSPKQPCYLNMVDPEAVNTMCEAGPGATITLSLGGKQDHIHSSPVVITGQVLHLLPIIPNRELPLSMGEAGVLQVGNIYIVVSERTGPGDNPIIYQGAGLDVLRAKILVAKSVVDWREGYKDIGKRFLLGEAPGLAPSNLKILNWKSAPRPIFPLDDNVLWNSQSAPIYRNY
jgi:microcystin degradation protein MlrC